MLVPPAVAQLVLQLLRMSLSKRVTILTMMEMIRLMSQTLIDPMALFLPFR
jgi:hypothetical protein